MSNFILILGANSDVARELAREYPKARYNNIFGLLKKLRSKISSNKHFNSLQSLRLGI